MVKKHQQSIVVPKANSTIYPEVGHFRRENALYSLLYYLIVFFSNILKNSPLTEAVRNGHTNIVRLLIENGADVNTGRWVR